MTMKKIIKKLLYRGLPIPLMIRPLIRSAYGLGVVCVEGLAFFRKLVWVEPVLRSVCETVGEGLRAERLPYMRGRGRLRLGNRVNLSGRSCFYFPAVDGEDPVIQIGDDTFIGNGCTLSAARGITIGSKTLISAMVRIHDNDGHPLDPAKRLTNERLTAADIAAVTIGSNVWIGAEALILKGVTIGDGAVVGARAVVTHDVPERTVVAGNPAREIKHLS